jgi:uncharacterized protein (TIGR00299 family) protein
MRECNHKGEEEELVERTILYVDPWSGVSGDMLLAALLDLDREEGSLEAELRRTIGGLGLGGTGIAVDRETEWGIACTRVALKEEGGQPLRSLVDMEAVLAAASVSESVRAKAVRAVRRLAEVEASVHGCGVEEVHFHEVGAADTLVDVVGVFALAEVLGIDDVVAGRIPVGGGSVEIAHGRMGVPAPATLLLLAGYEIEGSTERQELTTPTGALLVGELGARAGVFPVMRAEKAGYGAGRAKLEKGPNLLRVVLGKWEGGEGVDSVVELETNLDDASPEVLGYAIGLLRDAGVLDVWVVPAYMKKDRPGWVVHTLVDVGMEERATRILFEQTGTLGIRRRAVSRHVAERGTVEVTVGGRTVRVKWGRWEGQLVSTAPEYDDCVQVATATGVALKDVMRAAAESARGLLHQD